MNNKYRASLVVPLTTNLYKDDTDFSNAACIMSVSIGHPAYNSSKLKSTLELINKTFSKCTIAVCDTLSRYTIALKKDQFDEIQMHAEARKLGDEWLDRNNKLITDTFTQIKYNIKRWDDYLAVDLKQYYIQKIDELYTKDLEFRNLVEQTILGFLAKRKIIYDDDNFSHSYELCKKFLLEECAIMSMWCEVEDVDYDVYPDIRYKAISRAMQHLVPKEKYIAPLGIRCTKNSNAQNPLSAENVLNRILKYSPAHIYWKDKHGYFQGCNDKQGKFFGLERGEEAINKKDEDFFNIATANKIRKNDLSVIKNKKGIKFKEVVVQNKKTYHFLSQKVPLLDNNNIGVGVLGVSVDITDEIKQKQELKKALRAKNLFLDNVSHEIKIPLHVLTTVLDNLHDQWYEIEDREKRDYLKTAVESNKRLLSMINALLDLSRLQNNKMSFSFELTDFKQLVVNTVEEFKYISNKRETIVNFQEEVSYGVYCDTIRISQVIRNLIDNSYKYGNENKNINIKITREENNIRFAIDSHNYIPDEEFNCIFEAFTQGEIGQASAKGAGLGLTIAKNIILYHYGKIWVERKESGDNVIFIFEIPVKPNIK